MMNSYNTDSCSRRAPRIWLACFLFACLAESVVAAPAQAQDPSELRAVYGRGVHAYFAGNTTLAEQLFSQVIDSGSQDPRAYYFRAMIYVNSGRKFQAEYDMRVGATFEARDPGLRFAVGKALQRVQGSGRRTLEKFRRQARLERVQMMRSQSQQRYEQLQNRESVVLHKDEQVKLDSLLGPQVVGAPPKTETVLPLEDKSAEVLAQPAEVEPVESNEDDPFGFGDEEEMPLEEQPGEEMPVEEEDEDLEDIFGDDSSSPSPQDTFLEDEQVASASAAVPAGAMSPVGSMFYQWGFWLGQKASVSNGGASGFATSEAEFELGPGQESFSFGEDESSATVDEEEEDLFPEF